jgi:hypothetical protein
MKIQEEQLGKQQTAQRNAQIVYNIPVIFHIIHNGEAVGTGTNIAKLYVDAQLQQLNNDFRKLAGTSGYNSHPFGADILLQFSAAKLDKNNNALAEQGYRKNKPQCKGMDSTSAS